MCGIFIVAACNGFVASGQFFDTESVKEKKERRKQCGVCIFYRYKSCVVFRYKNKTKCQIFLGRQKSHSINFRNGWESDRNEKVTIRKGREHNHGEFDPGSE